MLNSLALYLCLALVCAHATAQNAPGSANKGHLVIIGGGPRPEAVMKKIIALAGGAKARLVVMPMASSEPLEVATAQKEQFEKFGAPHVDIVNCTAATASNPALLELVRKASGVFFSGGDQTKLKKAIWKTPMLDEVRALYKRGGVIAGTSAGAAVQSKVMLTGDEALNRDTSSPYGSIQAGNIVTEEGFGFVDNLVIDQHFIKRKRHNRLLTLVLEHPQLACVGIDESACIIVKPDETFEVLGDATVMVFDAGKAKNIKTDRNKNLSATGVALHVLPSGGAYNIKTRTVIR